MTAFNFAGSTTDVFQISNGGALGVASFASEVSAQSVLIAMLVAQLLGPRRDTDTRAVPVSPLSFVPMQRTSKQAAIV